MIEISLAPGITFFSAEKGILEIARKDRRTKLHGVEGVETALNLLAVSPSSLESMKSSIEPRVRGTRHDRTPKRLRMALQMLARRELIQVRCVAEGKPLMASLRLGPFCPFDFDDLDADPTELHYQLSRFVCLHREEELLIIDCPRQGSRTTVLAPEIGSLVTAAAQRCTIDVLKSKLPYISDDVLAESIRFLAGLGAIGRVIGSEQFDEDTDATLAQREFHDVLMHSYSRTGLSNRTVGALYPFGHEIAPSPPVKSAMTAETIALPLPDLNQLVSADPPFAKVMEERRSIRHYGDQAISLAQLAEFLYRVARVRTVQVVGDGEQKYEITNRPYPTGGAAYDLEIYLAIRACDGLQPGFYHYDPAGHSLSFIEGKESLVNESLRAAYVASGSYAVPPILFVITSRFSRLSWKYRGIAYAITLRNVGVLYEAMYLAATAMKLAPCALGSGNSGKFAEAFSIDPLVESPVGEFMLGTLPT